MNLISKIESTPLFDFDDQAWRPFPKRKRDELRLASNELWHNTHTKIGAVVCPKATKYPEHPLSKTALDYLADAVCTGRTSAGLVVLSRWEGVKRVVVTEIPVDAMITALAGIVPREGPFGPYFWLRPDGTPYDDDGEIPF